MGYKTKVFDTIADLRTRRGAPDTKVRVQGYYVIGDSGGGDFYWNDTSSLSDDAGMVIKPTGHTGNGRWLRIVDSPEIWLTWFGAKINDQNAAASNSDAITRAFNVLASETNVRFSTLYVPADDQYHTYWFSQKINVRGLDVRIRGDHKTQFAFYTTGGIYAWKSNCNSLIIENISVSDYNWNGNYIGLGGQYDPTKHGIFLNVPFTLRNVVVSGFKGDGIRVYGNSGDTVGTVGIVSSVVNTWMMDTVTSTYNMGDGVGVYGPDANAGLAMRLSSYSNGGWGLKDSSWLGNTYIGSHFAYNFWWKHRRNGCKVTNAQGTYYFLARQDSINVPPVIGQDNEYWEGTGQFFPTDVAEWNNSTYYYGTGAFTTGRTTYVQIEGKQSGTPQVINTMNNRSVLIGTYCESGMPSSKVGTYTLNFGGTQETPSSIGNSTEVLGGKLTTDVFNPTKRIDWNGGVASFGLSTTDTMVYNSSKATTITSDTSLKVGINSNPSYFVYSDTVTPSIHRHIWGSFAPTNTGHKFQFWYGDVGIIGGALQIWNKDSSTSTTKVVSGTAAPTEGTWTAGTFVFNASPSSTSSPLGWRCISSGSPGTWQTIAP